MTAFDDHQERLLDALRRRDDQGVEDSLAAMQEHVPDDALSGEMITGMSIFQTTYGAEIDKGTLTATLAKYTPRHIVDAALGLEDPLRPDLFHSPKTPSERAESVAWLLLILYNHQAADPLPDRVSGVGRSLLPGLDEPDS